MIIVLRNLLTLFISTSLVLVIGQSFASELAQFYYPDASFFNPSAFTYRNFQGNFSHSGDQWLKNNNSEVFSFLISMYPELIPNDSVMTILVPTDRAFSQLTTEIREWMSKSKNMERLLKYHFIPQIIAEDDIKKGEVTTLEGSSVKISTRVLPDKNIEYKLNEAIAKRSEKFDDNLIIISIDKVILPSNF